jgi:hypothetical protein
VARRPLRKGEAPGRRATAIGARSTGGQVLASRVEAVLEGSLTCVDRRRGVGLGAFALNAATLGAEALTTLPDRPWLTGPQTAAVLGCSKRALRAILGAGLLEQAAVPEGGMQRPGRNAWVRIDRASVAAFRTEYVLGMKFFGNSNHPSIRRTRQNTAVPEDREEQGLAGPRHTQLQGLEAVA